jgi:hypothetical protein
MIANQMAGKAARDALFLSNFDAEVLPRMVVGAALLIWVLVPLSPKVAAVALWLHLSSFGAVLISWFWSLISERFDPRTARQRIGRIASGGTLGGLIGGGVAAVASAFPIAWLLPVLAGFHGICALVTGRIGVGQTEPQVPAEEDEGRSGFRVLSEVPYLRNLALLVMTGTVSAAFVDFAFKFHAAAAYRDEQKLLLFFALFYTGVALITFVIQSTLTRRSLENLGLARTVSSLPFVVAIGSLAAFVFPGLAMIGGLRGAESAVRSSLFRSSYELFYTPIRKSEKRASKTIVDVGFDRLGDALGGGIVQVVLLTGAAASQILMAFAAALSLLALAIARRLHQGYVDALEKSLLRHGRAEAPTEEEEEATRTGFFQTVSQLELTSDLPDLGPDVSLATAAIETSQIPAVAPPSTPTTPPAPPKDPPVALDPLLVRSMDLRSGDPTRVRKTLQSVRALPSEIVPLVIPLLAWDLVAPLAIRSLRRVCDRHTGQLLDSLLDSNEEFSIRRRIPRVLSYAKTERAVEGLLHGLKDRRFEVRYQCGVALAKVHEKNPDLPVDRDAVLTTVGREAHVDRRVWESQRLLDEQSGDSPFHDQVLRERSSRSLEHVFTVLSLIYPKQPLTIAYRGLHTEDQNLRGTALEYLESILPPALQESLWPFLDEGKERVKPTKSRDEILDSLLRSHESIQIDLNEIRKRAKEEEG